MNLYGNETSPYVRKVRVLALEKGIDCPLVKVDYADPASPVHVHNPLGKIPVMALNDGSALYDSPVIVEYIDSLKVPALIPAGGEARWQVLRWQALADGMMTPPWRACWNCAARRSSRPRRACRNRKPRSRAGSIGPRPRCATNTGWSKNG